MAVGIVEIHDAVEDMIVKSNLKSLSNNHEDIRSKHSNNCSPDMNLVLSTGEKYESPTHDTSANTDNISNVVSASKKQYLEGASNIGPLVRYGSIEQISEGKIALNAK
jgi:hypothetical protein